MVVGVVNRTSNVGSQFSKLMAYPNAWILELAKDVWLDCNYNKQILCIVVLRKSIYQ